MPSRSQKARTVRPLLRKRWRRCRQRRCAAGSGRRPGRDADGMVTAPKSKGEPPAYSTCQGRDSPSEYDATAFDRRDINRNFAYDYEAYGAVKRNLGRLIDAGQLPVAMQLALELMKQGSYQVEMSDEGLMTPDIEDCLAVVLAALEKCDLAATEVIAWCAAMLDNDRAGFIARRPLQSLRNRVQATAGM
jgi:hypothetical protein